MRSLGTWLATLYSEYEERASSRAPPCDNHVLSPPAGEIQREGGPYPQNGEIRDQTLTLSLSLIFGRGNAVVVGCR
jgi:hypothetical protein